MKQLAPREEQIMQIIWQEKAVFIREIIEHLPEPKPHYNTVATIVKILVDKGFLTSQLLGNTHQYTPKVSLESYREQYLGDIKKNYFGGSFSSLVAHFAQKEELSENEIEDLLKIINANKS